MSEALSVGNGSFIEAAQDVPRLPGMRCSAADMRAPLVCPSIRAEASWLNHGN
jgi:hypothetical protein